MNKRHARRATAALTFRKSLLVAAVFVFGARVAAAGVPDPCERALVLMTTDDGAAKVVVRVLDPNHADGEELSSAALFEIVIDRGPASADRWGLIRAPVRPEVMPKVVDALGRELTRLLNEMPLNQRRSVQTRARGRVATITRQVGTTFELRAINDAVTGAVVIDRRADPVRLARDGAHSVIEIGEVDLAADYLAQLMLARLFPDAAEADLAATERGSVH